MMDALVELAVWEIFYASFRVVLKMTDDMCSSDIELVFFCVCLMFCILFTLLILVLSLHTSHSLWDI